MLSSTPATVVAISIGVAILSSGGYFVAGLFQIKVELASTFRSMARKYGIKDAQSDAHALIRILEGSQFLSLGHRQRVECGAFGDTSRGKLAIMMLQYSWDSTDRSRSRNLPVVVLVDEAFRPLESRSLHSVDGLDAARAATLQEYIQNAPPGTIGEFRDGALIVGIKRSAVQELRYSLRHPTETPFARTRRDLEQLVGLAHAIRDSFASS